MLTTYDQHDYLRGSFGEAIWPFLAVGQCFGIMPVNGVRSISKLEFKWTSLRTIYSLIIATVLLSYSLLLLFTVLHTKNETFSTVATTIFFTSGSCEIWSFLALARKWPGLIQKWRNIERNLATFQSKRQKDDFVFKIRLRLAIITVLAIIEHTLSMVSHWDFDDKAPFTKLIKAQVPYFFTFDEQPSIWNMICAKSLSLIATVLWNFTDIFIMAISIGLSIHFKLFNDELERIRKKNVPVEIWMRRRSQYANLCYLVTVVDKKIAFLSLISYTSNLILTCKQLYNASRHGFGTWLRVLYFWYSFIYLILRIFFVSFFAACINDESKKPVSILQDVPSESWNNSKGETTRFYFDVISEDVALSGMKFFLITRKFILSVTATIATYEIILLQFHFYDNS